MAKPNSVASYLIDLSSNEPENDLTNLKLQKILFYAQAESLVEGNVPILDGQVEAWTYGPVVRETYDWLRGCGGYPITSFDVVIDYSELDDHQRHFLDRVWNTYGKFSPGFLVKKTHEDGSPWSQVYRDYANNVIPEDLIRTAVLANAW